MCSSSTPQTPDPCDAGPNPPWEADWGGGGNAILGFLYFYFLGLPTVSGRRALPPAWPACPPGHRGDGRAPKVDRLWVGRLAAGAAMYRVAATACRAAPSVEHP